MQTLSVIKRFWRSLIYKLICFQSLGIKYLHDISINSVRVGTGNKLLMIVLDVRMHKLLALPELKLSLV